MEYSWTLRVAGEKIVFLPEVSVYGAMLGSGGKAAANQRRRWEFGRSEIRKKYLGSLLRSNELGWSEKALSTCELTIPSMATLAVIYVVVVGLDAIVWLRDSRLDSLRDASLFGCERGRHDRRVGCLRDFTVPGDAAPVAIPLQHLPFPVLRGLEADDLAGRPASHNGFGRRASPVR